jgi:hypothetical protein
LVVPKALRDRVGLAPGEVEVTVDGACVRVEPVHEDHVEERGGRLVIPASGAAIDDDLVRALRDSDRP